MRRNQHEVENPDCHACLACRSWWPFCMQGFILATNKLKEYVMNTSIVGRHVDLTDAIKDYVNSSVEVFKKYNYNLKEKNN